MLSYKAISDYRTAFEFRSFATNGKDPISIVIRTPSLSSVRLDHQNRRIEILVQNREYI